MRRINPRNRQNRCWQPWLACLFLLWLPWQHTAARDVEQYNLPQPQSYKHYQLRVEASTRKAEVGKPVILKAVLNPDLPNKDIQYQFLINGAPIKEPGMHKVHTFMETGTYKVSVVARLDGTYLLNSPPLIIHVIEAWIEPEAAIAPPTQVVKKGEIAIFHSESDIDANSRQWLYWSISSGHRGTGQTFQVSTERLAPGKYPIELLARDDRKRESTANAMLVVVEENSDVETLTLKDDNQTGPITDIINSPDDIQLYASHTHRLQGMQVVFWIQNAQPGAETQLQLDTGDGKVSGWSRRLRYGHAYQHFGIYRAQLSAKNSSDEKNSNLVTLYIWPLWFPILMMVMGLFLAGIPFFKRQQRREVVTEYPIHYAVINDPGHHQLIIYEDKQTPALRIRKHEDQGKQLLSPAQGQGTETHA